MVEYVFCPQVLYKIVSVLLLIQISENNGQRAKFMLQLQNFYTQNYRLISDDCSCARKIGDDKTIWPFCNYQFTTSINFPKNLASIVISSHLINPTNNWIYFDRTKAVLGCNENVSRLLKFKFSCNDTTWQNPITYFLEDVPTSISIVVAHYGDAVCGGVALDHWIPPTNWLVDTFHFYIRDLIPFAYNVTPGGRNFNLMGLENRGNSLQFWTSIQCLSGWWGPACNFSSCIYGRRGVWKCKEQQDEDFYWLCSNDTLSFQASNCTYCSGIIIDGICVKPPLYPPTPETNSGIWIIIGLIFFGLLALIELLLIFALVYKMRKKRRLPAISYLIDRNSNKNGPWWTVKPATGEVPMRQKPAQNGSNTETDPEWPVGDRRSRRLSYRNSLERKEPRREAIV